jgi:hypothetical protein
VGVEDKKQYQQALRPIDREGLLGRRKKGIDNRCEDRKKIGESKSDFGAIR